LKNTQFQLIPIMKFTGFWKLMQSSNNLLHYEGTCCLHLLPCHIKKFYMKSLHLTHSNIWPVLAHAQVSSFMLDYFFHIFIPNYLSFLLSAIVFPSLLLLYFFPTSFICLSYCHSSSLSCLSLSYHSLYRVFHNVLRDYKHL
jgi:hypothetical protein